METLQTPATVQTRCPNCQTVFELPDDVIRADDPRVRCGECLTVFSSRDNLLVTALSDDLLVDPDSTLVTPMGPANEEPDFDNEKMVFDPDDTLTDAGSGRDMDLFSDEAELPEVAYLDDEDIPEIDIASMQSAEDQFDSTLFDDVYFEDEADVGAEATRAVEPSSETALPDAYTRMAEFGTDITQGTEEPESLAPDGLEEALSEHDIDVETEEVVEPHEPQGTEEQLEALEAYTDEYAEQETVYTPAPLPAANTGKLWLTRAVMVALLVLGLGALYFFSLRGPSSSASLGSVASQDCGSNCGEAALLEQLHVVRRTVYSHPRVADALVINVVFRNDAQQAQPYPVLDISMSDIRGGIVAARQFQPHEYMRLQDGQVLGDIASGEAVDVSLEIVDPGDNARSFELAFR